MRELKFYKYTGAGNDFIMIDGFILTPQEINEIIEKIPYWCARGTGVGADGLIIIQKHDTLDFQMRYFNSDGSEAEMCGNGGRCAAKFTFNQGYASQKLKFKAISGIYTAQILDEDVKLQMQDAEWPQEKTVKISAGKAHGFLINTGVPHFILFKQNNSILNQDEISNWGREIRFHEAFQPSGTNVNFIELIDEHNLNIRTYERGVEQETLACGTGSTAAGIIAVVNGLCKSPVHLKTRSGLILTIDLELKKEKVMNIFLTGEARLVYTGVIKI